MNCEFFQIFHYILCYIFIYNCFDKRRTQWHFSPSLNLHVVAYEAPTPKWRCACYPRHISTVMQGVVSIAKTNMKSIWKS